MLSSGVRKSTNQFVRFMLFFLNFIYTILQIMVYKWQPDNWSFSRLFTISHKTDLKMIYASVCPHVFYVTGVCVIVTHMIHLLLPVDLLHAHLDKTTKY